MGHYLCAIKSRIDHIIIGQGLAGSCLALQLIRQGKKILVFDEPSKNRSSAIAAGLFNPITGKFLKQTWMAEDIFPYLFEFYHDAETLLGKKFFFPGPIYRPFVSIEEQNEWMARSEEQTLRKFIAEISTQPRYGSQVNDPFGGLVTKQSGYLDTRVFLRAVADFLVDTGALRCEYFDAAKLKMGEGSLCYESTVADSVIFCDGLWSKSNLFFGWIPLQPLKGEILTVTLAEKPGAIFNRGIYVVPTDGDAQFLVGATYRPGDRTEQITSTSRQEMEEKLASLIRLPFQVNHQNWGMRPTTPDRRPILGFHPEFKNLIIFNGLGTKGVSLAPYFSNQLALCLEGHLEIPMAVNIERFKSLYSRFSFA